MKIDFPLLKLSSIVIPISDKLRMSITNQKDRALSKEVSNEMSNILPYLILGLLAGILSGLIGIGGGIIIVPALVFVFGMTQHQAQGTTLALMVPPVGLLAAWSYYTRGFVDFKIAGLIIVGFFIGGLVGGKIAVGLSSSILQKVFALALFFISIKIFFGK
ncbi:MAG: sulfite exporter TauE/SafE family protein [Syntrophomonas sp.]|nr:sulfite exporter TauE/SafE family protein [Syntrophomonas sp.]